MPRRVLIAPDKFKGSLSALEAAEAMAAGVRDVDPDAQIDLCPIADGGEGFMEALKPALNGRWVTVPAVDALGRAIESRYLLADTPEGPVAVIEMAATAGIARLSPDERNPLQATTRGTGMQVIDAIERHSATHIVLGLGGSATNDAGCGFAAALGVAFLDAEGRTINPLPINLTDVHEVDLSKRIALPRITVACDVDNPLLGPRGATAIFSNQKGASDDDKPQLEAALSHIVKRADATDAAKQAGAGAAGGLGFGLLHFAKASLVPGFDLIADLIDFDRRLESTDLVLTGEGSLDAQSLGGKGPVALARRAHALGVPVAAFCGIADDAARESGLFTVIHSLEETGRPLEELIRDAAELLRQSVRSSPCLLDAPTGGA